MSIPSKGVVGRLPDFLRPLGMLAASCFSAFPGSDDSPWLDDLWPGDPERGKHIVNRRFTLAGCDISFSRQTGWYAKEATLPWLRALHGFSWMRDVAAYHDEKKSAKRLRQFVEDWMHTSEPFHSVSDEPAVIGERLANWATYAQHIALGSSPKFRRQLLRSVQSQAWRLRRTIIRRTPGAFSLPAIRGLLLVSLAVPGCGFLYREARTWLDYYLAGLQGLATKARERNPIYLHGTLRGLIDIQAAMRFRHYDDEVLDGMIADLVNILRHVLHEDGGFALFNGAIEGDVADIAYTLAYESLTGIAPVTPEELLERTGYARLEAGESRIFMDIGVPEHAQADAYHGTQSFEWSHAGQRCIVNCGAYVGNDAAWSRVVRTTAAHSTLCMDNRNSNQFSGEYVARLSSPLAQDARPTVQHRLASRDGYLFLEGIYNGYTPYSGLIHTRQLLINDKGTRFSGADYLNHANGYGEINSHDVHLRFHLHPSVQAKRLMNGMIILQLPERGGKWSFQASLGQATELEESIYLGIDGRPMLSYQIVVHASFNPESHTEKSPWLIEWSFLQME